MDASRRQLLSLAAMAPVAGALLPGAAVAADDPEAVARDTIRQRHFPDVVLRTQDNQKVHFYRDLIKDKVVTINFFFSRCDEICPRVTANLVKVQKLLGDRVGRDIFMNSITLKPKEDTPAVLKQFAKLYRAGPGWRFLTGKLEDIELLRRSMGFTDPDPRRDRDVNNHIGNVRYGNERRMLWAACPGMANAKFIVESISWVMPPEDKPQITRGS